MKSVRKAFDDCSGVTSIEYALIAALIGIAIIGGATVAGDSLDAMFTAVGGTLQANTP